MTDARKLKFTWREHALLRVLIAAGKDGISRAQIVKDVFTEEDGGPVTANQVINVLRKNINAKIAPHGLVIISVRINPDNLNWYQRRKHEIAIYRPEEIAPAERGLNWEGNRPSFNHPVVRWKFAELSTK